jgi:hypothetical protein
MKKEIGKWFMDIAKYIATAVVLSFVYSEIQDKSTFLIFGISSIIVAFAVGVFLLKEPKNEVVERKE